jgi:glycosyltransferase involved in cell wall biosynthesis
VYDLIPLVYRDRYLIHPKQSSVYNKYLACLANLDKLFCISHTTENDVKSRLQVRGEIVYAGTAVDSVIFNRAIPLDSDYLVEFGLQSKNYVVSVASSDERKGMLRALEAHFGSYDRNTRGIGLALIGNLDPRSKANMEKIIYARKSSLLSKGIRVDAPIVLIPKVTDDKIVQLYLNALFSVFVSYYEGAGLPVLESMQMGVPVVAGDRSAIPEFAGEGDQVAYCDPTSIPSISRAMTTMIRRCIDVSPQVITQACYQQADKFDWSSICQVIIDKLDLS